MVIGVMKVAIIGLGFVGLSFAVVLGQKNFPVLGIDIDQEKILKIKKTKRCYFWSENGDPGPRPARKIHRKTTSWRLVPTARRTPNSSPERPSKTPKATPW